VTGDEKNLDPELIFLYSFIIHHFHQPQAGKFIILFGVLMELGFLWLIFPLIAAYIGSKKGEAGMAFFVGLIFGPFGVLFAILSRGKRKACPTCREMIHKAAVVCPHCRRDTRF